MIGIGVLFLFLAIKKGFEPYLLIPIAFGIILVNLLPEIYITESVVNKFTYTYLSTEGIMHSFTLSSELTQTMFNEMIASGQIVTTSSFAEVFATQVVSSETVIHRGLLGYLHLGVECELYPCCMGIPM